MMKPLYLVLKPEWYDMIEQGIKLEEYRELTPYWVKRLTTLKYGFLLFSHRYSYEPIPFKAFDKVTFQRAYPKNPPRMTFEVKGMEYGFGNPAWGAPTDRKVFIIKLGNKV